MMVLIRNVYEDLLDISILPSSACYKLALISTISVNLQLSSLFDLSTLRWERETPVLKKLHLVGMYGTSRNEGETL